MDQHLASRAKTATPDAFMRAVERLNAQRPIKPRLQRIALRIKNNEFDGAERELGEHLAKNPNDADAISLLARVHTQIGQRREALALLERCLVLVPEFDAVRFNYADALFKLNKPQAALEQLDLLLARDAANPLYRQLKANVFETIGENERSMEICEELVSENPGRANSWMSYGHAARAVGAQEKSIHAYRKAIECRPSYGQAWWALANMKTVRFGDDDIAAMQKQLARSDISQDDRITLQFSLAKAFEDKKEYDKSFDQYAKANAAVRLRIDYDPDTLSNGVATNKRLFTPAFLDRHRDTGCKAPDPIFILGRPRSGSTLIEQILASHSQIEGTAELPYITALAGRLGGKEGPIPYGISYLKALSELSPAEFTAMGEEFMHDTRVHRKTDRPFFIDKKPANFSHIGLIHLILPNAKIIDARRHPCASALSMFKTYSSKGRLRLSELGRFYRDYVELMEHFDKVLPGRVHRVIYENMVSDTEAETRRLIDYLGLPFEDSCLRFFETKRTVLTPSSEQVRRPITGEAVDHWRNFEPWLNPLIKSLGTVFSEYPNVPQELRLIHDMAAAEDFGRAAEMMRPDYALKEPLLREANALIKVRRFGLAGKLLREFLGSHSHDPQALHLLAENIMLQGRISDALPVLARCAENAPGALAPRYAYANLLLRANSPDAALAQADVLLQHEPRNPMFRRLKAIALEAVENYRGSDAIWRELMADYPDYLEGALRHGHALRLLGARDEAVAAYSNILAREPSSGDAWWSLADLKTFRFVDSDVAAMEFQIGRSDLRPEDRVRILFALARAYDDRKAYEKAFRHYTDANALYRSTAQHDPDVLTAYVARCKSVFTTEFFRERAGWGHEGRDAIFLVGMPRAGSTLVEQILASHSQIEGTKELFDLAAISRQLQAQMTSDTGTDYPQGLARLDGPSLKAIGARYLETTRAHRKLPRPFFTDKMGANFVHVGLIRMILPHAKIVDVRRHPMACGFSMFAQLFPKGENHAYRLSDIGRVYRDYVDLMEHFNSVLPGTVHRVFYEQLVADPEAEVRHLLAYLELPFEESCMTFYKTERVVTTVSSEQVRRPITGDARDHWRHYEPWLDPLKAELGPALDAYPHARKT